MKLKSGKDNGEKSGAKSEEKGGQRGEWSAKPGLAQEFTEGSKENPANLPRSSGTHQKDIHWLDGTWMSLWWT